MAALKGGIAGLVTGFSVAALSGIVSSAREIAKGVASIGDEARRAGLSTKAFQELKFVAEQNRVGVDALVDGFKELSLRADEFYVTGQGSGADAFKRLGFSAADLKRKLQDPSALFSEIIGKMGQLNKAAQIRVADEIFGGTGGEKFVQLISQGEEGIRRTVAQANELGLVLDDEVIERANEIDRKFNAIAGTVGTALKKAVVDVVGAMDDWLDRMNRLEEQTDRNIQSQLVGTYDKLREAKKLLEDLQTDKIAFPEDAAVDLNIDKQKQLIEDLTSEALKLRDILDRRSGYSENFIYKTGEDAKTAKPPVDTLNTSLDNSGTSAANGATGINSYADAIRALKNEVPELAKSLADLDAQTKINGAYRAALGKATTVQEVLEANALRDQATKAVKGRGAAEAANKGFLDLIGYAEGTDKGRGYNETLARGAFTGGDRNLVMMTLDQIDAMQTAMLRHPGNKYNSSAVGRYQIVQKTMRGLRGTMGLSGSDMFSPDIQDRMAQQLMRGRGNDPAGLRNEWEGLRNVDEQTIRGAYDGSSVSMPSIDPGIAQKNEALKDQATAYQDIITQSRAFVSEQTTEQQALGMSAVAASKLRYEQQMLNEAQRAGIALTPQQRSEISQLAQGMAEAEQATQRFAMTQEQAKDVSDFFASTASDALTGLIMGTTTAEDALKGLIASLAKAALQAALLGEGPLAGLLGGGGGKTGGGGLLGGIFGAIFGAKDGGEIQAFAGGGRVRGPGGPRADKVPAYLSDGEFVVNAAATAKNRAALEAINSGRTPALATMPGAGGGKVNRQVNQISNVFSPTIPITVQASGNQEADAKMTERLTAEMGTLLENKMTEFVQKNQRTGAMLNRKGFV
ncbi:lysozyme family protein [Pararhizobium qamdonense]|uniref:phage tail protein n=1 Tax=Pararhizobium qamdonense TaxID=3031126 RepID=UPI0023E1B464|nr:phage tail protein [Pararhizobium qamdonense]